MPSFERNPPFDNFHILFQGNVIRLELYRLMCHFHSSKLFSKLTDGSDWCPYQPIREQFEHDEVIRILLTSAIFCRTFAGSVGDERRKEWLASSNVGILQKNAKTPLLVSINIREACNKIIHAKTLTLGRVHPYQPYYGHLRPFVYLHSSRDRSVGWNAKLDIHKYVAEMSQLAAMFE